MKTNYFEYKGYHTRIDFDYDSLTLFGKIEGIDDLILFENEDATKIEEEFHKAVDNYLLFCEEVGKTPEKEYKGVFNVRVTPELHRALSTIAFQKSETLNSIVEEALENYVDTACAMIDSISYGTSSTNEYTCDNNSYISTGYSKNTEVC